MALELILFESKKARFQLDIFVSTKLGPENQGLVGNP